MARPETLSLTPIRLALNQFRIDQISINVNSQQNAVYCSTKLEFSIPKTSLNYNQYKIVNNEINLNKIKFLRDLINDL